VARLAIVAVGSMKDRAEKALYERYAEGITLREVEGASQKGCS
jgi:hypothetical protein